MSWTKMARRRADRVGRSWSPEEVKVIVRAVDRAPSVHHSQPWLLEAQERRANLWERTDQEIDRHDPYGRDRRISCGAALANLILAVREVGWAAEVQWGEDADLSDLVASVAAYTRRKPSATDGQRYRAINRRSSYRRAFENQAIPHATREALWAAATSSGVHARWVTGAGEAFEVARLLTYAARVYQGDVRYQRELAAWTVERTEEDPGQGIRADALGTEGLPAVGLARSETRLPDEQGLAERIERESVLIVSTSSDERIHHFRAGESMQMAWLGATSLGLATSVMTQPLQLSEVRSGLADQLGIPAVPEVMMRFGYPGVDIPTRRRSSDLTFE